MPEPTNASLLPTTIRRSMVAGRFYLVFGGGFSIILAVTLSQTSVSGLTAGFPLLLPMFATLGSLGALMVFVGDRTKGVFEYLIAYGIRPWSIFANTLLAAIVLTSLVMGTAWAAGVGISFALGGVPPWDYEVVFLAYTIPVTFASAIFATAIGCYWSSLSSPRAGINSPVGLAPLIGIAPAIFILILASVAPPDRFLYVTGGAAAGLVALVVILIALSGRLLKLERFLSPM